MEKPLKENAVIYEDWVRIRLVVTSNKLHGPPTRVTYVIHGLKKDSNNEIFDFSIYNFENILILSRLERE